MIGGVFSPLGTALQSIGQGVGTVASKIAGNTNIHVSIDDIRKQVESVLRATGKEELQPEQVKKGVGAVADRAQGGRPMNQVTDSALSEVQQKLTALDRDAAINVMVNKLGMTRPQAEQMAQSTIGVIGPIKHTMQNVKEQSVGAATTAIAQIGSAAWGLFLLALLTLGASLSGGTFGIGEAGLYPVQEQPVRDVRRTG